MGSTYTIITPSLRRGLDCGKNHAMGDHGRIEIGIDSSGFRWHPTHLRVLSHWLEKYGASDTIGAIDDYPPWEADDTHFAWAALTHADYVEDDLYALARELEPLDIKIVSTPPDDTAIYDAVQSAPVLLPRDEPKPEKTTDDIGHRDMMIELRDLLNVSIDDPPDLGPAPEIWIGRGGVSTPAIGVWRLSGRDVIVDIADDSFSVDRPTCCCGTPYACPVHR